MFIIDIIKKQNEYTMLDMEEYEKRINVLIDEKKNVYFMTLKMTRLLLLSCMTEGLISFSQKISRSFMLAVEFLMISVYTPLKTASFWRASVEI